MNRAAALALFVGLAAVSTGCSATLKVGELIATGDARKLRDRGKDAPPREEHPHPTYVAVDERLRDLAVGPRGERAGDIFVFGGVAGFRAGGGAGAAAEDGD